THAHEVELRRFKTEAETIARLHHPNIVQIYEVGLYPTGSGAECPYMALEFCSGGSLAARLDGTPLPAEKSARLIADLARGIHQAHDAGVVHRDLKPANILFDGGDVAKITDFGLAKKFDDTTGPTHTNAVMGTPSYMPPEQAAGKMRHFKPPGDVYAL